MTTKDVAERLELKSLTRMFEKPVTFEGRFYHLHEAQLLPRSCKAARC